MKNYHLFRGNEYVGQFNDIEMMDPKIIQPGDWGYSIHPRGWIVLTNMTKFNESRWWGIVDEATPELELLRLIHT